MQCLNSLCEIETRHRTSNVCSIYKRTPWNIPWLLAYHTLQRYSLNWIRFSLESWVRWYATVRFVFLVVIPFFISFFSTFIWWEICIVNFTLYQSGCSLYTLFTPYVPWLERFLFFFLPAFDRVCVCVYDGMNLLSMFWINSINPFYSSIIRQMNTFLVSLSTLLLFRWNWSPETWIKETNIENGKRTNSLFAV